MMSVYTFDPISDPRWEAFVDSHPNASVFHTAHWMRALQLTYGYKPIVYTTDAPSEALTNCIPLCSVRSWLTGNRLVSLPFSDHCQPLVSDDERLFELLGFLADEVDNGKWKYVELRPLGSVGEKIAEYRDGIYGISDTYLWFTLDLTPDVDSLFASFHKSSVRQRINRSQREGLEYREGVTDNLLRDFYNLLISTRKKHHVPPQPFEWFLNLRNAMGNMFVIRSTYKDNTPTSSKITLNHRYAHCAKYGASDSRYDRLGGTQFLTWQAMCNAKEDGAHIFDLGRCETTNTGLASYKSEWGAKSVTLNYYRYPAPAINTDDNIKMKIAGRIFSLMPNRMLIAFGKLLYKHIG